ncbi:unnamed protein product [Effrenium voratum]|uniref:Uncharacterized protein n=1 Tax=Effrenium voratum TaxID=2562239 RepID=A0AA36NJT2_9DINO|nr:unnamed protein product [Effrenium voratum]
MSRPNQAEDSELQAELQGAQMRLKNAQRITSTKALLGKLPSACDRAMAQKRMQQVKGKLAETKRDEAKEMKKFTQRSAALQKEISVDEAKGRKKSAEKAKFLEKAQNELLKAENEIEAVGRQQSEVSAEAVQRQNGLALQKQRDAQDLRRASERAEQRQKLADAEKRQRRQDQEQLRHWKKTFHDEVASESLLASKKHRLQEEIGELRADNAAEESQLKDLAKAVRQKGSLSAKMRKFLDKEPELAHAVKERLNIG